MNKPTPFGKTYKEYTEAVEKFELSKVKKVSLGLIDDLDKLISKQDSAIPKLLKQADVLEKQGDLVQKEYQKKLKVKEELERLQKEEDMNEKKWQSEQDSRDDILTEVVSIRKLIEKDLDVIKKQAKTLGVDIPLGKYENALKENKSATGRALRNEDLPF